MRWRYRDLQERIGRAFGRRFHERTVGHAGSRFPSTAGTPIHRRDRSRNSVKRLHAGTALGMMRGREIVVPRGGAAP